MKPNIQTIVEDIINLDPDLAGRNEELYLLVEKLIKHRPHFEIDSEFVQKLRSHLNEETIQLEDKRVEYPLRSIFYALGGTLAAAVLIVPLVYFSTSRSGTIQSGFSSTPQIEHTNQRNAFGTIFLPTDAQQESASNPASERSQSGGGGGMGGDAALMSPMIVAPFNPVVYKLAEELRDLNASGQVYNRKFTPISGNVMSAISGIDFELFNLNSFPGLKVQRIEFVDQKDPGYNMYVDFERGEVSIGTIRKNYLDYEKAQARLKNVSMSNEDAISIATKFLNDHGINISAYETPIVEAPRIAPDAPKQQWLNVKFPISIDGAPVYEMGGERMGITVMVDILEKRVESVYNLTSYSFTSSQYELETDTNKIVPFITNGGSLYRYAMPESNGKEITVELGAPEKVLVRYYDYKDNTARELLVPALKFTVPERELQSGEWYTPQNIVVPLLKEVFDITRFPDIMPTEDIIRIQ